MGQAVKTKKRRDDFQVTIESRGATFWPQNLRYLIEHHNMNYWKVLCLQWRNSTGKSCGKRTHNEDEYKNELECEAQLTESIVVAVQGGKKTNTELGEALLELHVEMGCDCDWQPISKPLFKDKNGVYNDTRKTN